MSCLTLPKIAPTLLASRYPARLQQDLPTRGVTQEQGVAAVNEVVLLTLLGYADVVNFHPSLFTIPNVSFPNHARYARCAPPKHPERFPVPSGVWHLIPTEANTTTNACTRVCWYRWGRSPQVSVTLYHAICQTHPDLRHPTSYRSIGDCRRVIPTGPLIFNARCGFSPPIDHLFTLAGPPALYPGFLQAHLDHAMTRDDFKSSGERADLILSSLNAMCTMFFWVLFTVAGLKEGCTYDASNHLLY